MGASIARKLTRLGPRVLRHQQAQVCASSCFMSCFFMRRDGLSILKACSYIFYLIWASGSHVTWNSAVPDPNVWCCILLFLCTLDTRQLIEARGMFVDARSKMFRQHLKCSLTEKLHQDVQEQAPDFFLFLFTQPAVWPWESWYSVVWASQSTW